MKSSGKAVISGIGISEIGRRLPVGHLDLTLQAAREAIADAGLTCAEVDGVGTLGETPLDAAALALGLEPAWRDEGYGHGGLLTNVMNAAQAVQDGRARHVLVYRTVKMVGGTALSTDARPQPESGRRPADGPPSGMVDIPQLLAYHAYAAPNWVAMHCRRHMHLYGTTKAQLGWVAVNNRRNAMLNPRAVLRTELTLDDYLGARPVSTPFGLYDCDVPIDGSIAVVVSHPAYAADAPKPALRVEAFGGAAGLGGWTLRPDYPAMSSRDAAREMWSRTHLTPRDIDIAQLYDGFTYLTLDWLEALGICGVGEAGPFVEGGERIARDGQLPLNTYGGQLSAGRLHGFWVLHEACVQLRGEGGARQVPRDLHVAAVASGGGPIVGCLLLTR
jgi:acetyl-CoA acetyltransferase